MKVAVITPTIGNPKLVDALASVDRQTYTDLTHYIFIDGKEYVKPVESMLEGASKVKTVVLEENVGKGWYGHRVFAACSFLVNADIICYLDEDNWFEDCHIEKLVKKIQDGYDWAYSLRKIYDKDGNFLCEDNCESLGKWPVYFNNEVHHIDTSSFAVKRDCAVRIGHAWYGQWGADRQFFSNLSKFFPKFDCTNVHTSCYRLDGNPNSVTKEFFDKGNQTMQERYGDNLPWKSTQRLHQIEVGPGIKILA